ncbi:MAG: helix-turn-helix transcriptional regulator [Lachnospiraceae bacterium]|nr:helix-turn-helix transcriptional regulator [Lachnospiraceae bacterium]
MSKKKQHFNPADIARQNQRYIQIGLHIAYYRKMRNISQEQLADTLHVSRSYLSSIESPTKPVQTSVELLLHAADALDIPIQLLLEFDDCPQATS